MHISNTVMDANHLSLHDLATCPSQTLVSEKSGPDTTAKDCPLREITIPVIENNPTEVQNSTNILHSSSEKPGFEQAVNEGQPLRRSQRRSRTPQQYRW